MTVAERVEQLQRVIDLAQPVAVGMPHFPNNPAYLFALARPHGQRRLPGGASAAVEVIVSTTHAATHLDALGHFSRGGLLHGAAPAAAHQSYECGLDECGVDDAPIQPRRGVLLDLPPVVGQDPLPLDYEVTAGELAAAEQRAGLRVGPGDAVLLRTGWGRHWSDPAVFPALAAPGPALAAAHWLSERGVAMTGSDTLTYERVPNEGWPAHVHLLVERGVYIVEALNLEALSRAGAAEFIFVATPLRLVGATGSMIRPIAIL